MMRHRGCSTSAPRYRPCGPNAGGPRRTRTWATAKRTRPEAHTKRVGVPFKSLFPDSEARPPSSTPPATTATKKAPDCDRSPGSAPWASAAWVSSHSLSHSAARFATDSRKEFGKENFDMEPMYPRRRLRPSILHNTGQPRCGLAQDHIEHRAAEVDRRLPTLLSHA